MRELKLLYLYPDMLELYGDYGNQYVKYFSVASKV